MIIYNDKTFNKHFAEIEKALNIFAWPSNNKNLLNDQFTYRLHCKISESSKHLKDKE